MGFREREDHERSRGHEVHRARIPERVVALTKEQEDVKSNDMAGAPTVGSVVRSRLGSAGRRTGDRDGGTPRLGAHTGAIS